MATREEIVEKMKQKLDAWNSEMDELDGKIKNVEASVTEKNKARLEAMRIKCRELESKMNEIQASADDKLDGVKDEAENIFNAFKDSIAEFRSHFK